MAGVTEDPNGCKRIRYFDHTGKRKTLRLRMPMKQAEDVKRRVEWLVAAKISGTAPDVDTLVWLTKIGDGLHEKLAKHDLVAPRVRVAVPTLDAFVGDYIARRSDVKAGTVLWYNQTRRDLLKFFGADRRIDEITAGETKDFRRWLTCPKNKDGQGLGESTARKRCSIAKQFLADAVDRELIQRNPFGKMDGLSAMASVGRDYFVTREEADKILEACPNAEWRLIFGLSRYLGLRCPSEHLALTWGDIDWDRGRIVVRASKTSHHDGHGERIAPLFPELRPLLQAVLDDLLIDFDPKANRLSEQPVITRYRDETANLRTQLNRIVRKAGLTPWPRPFQNLRSTRATELAAEFPAHVAAEWLGHSTLTANKHYWKTTDADYERAAQNAAQQLPEDVGKDGNTSEQKCEIPEEIAKCPVFQGTEVHPRGFEPLTFGSVDRCSIQLS
jgi:integrase